MRIWPIAAAVIVDEIIYVSADAAGYTWSYTGAIILGIVCGFGVVFGISAVLD